VNYLKGKGVPILVSGGGGYTLRNVPRCWTYETSLMVNTEIPNEIPDKNDYFDYFCPEYKIHMSVSNMENLNTNVELEETTAFLLQTLKNIDGDKVQMDRSNYQNVSNPLTLYREVTTYPITWTWISQETMI
jgi:histone deacetylase 1/2